VGKYIKSHKYNKILFRDSEGFWVGPFSGLELKLSLYDVSVSITADKVAFCKNSRISFWLPETSRLIGRNWETLNPFFSLCLELIILTLNGINESSVDFTTFLFDWKLCLTVSWFSIW